MDNSKAVGWKVKEVKYKHRDIWVSTLAKFKQPGKNQKKEWFNQQQGNKGKAPARANEHVSFANEVQMKDEDVDLASRFVDHL